MVVRPFHSWNKYSSSFINYLWPIDRSPITHHPTAPSPSNVTNKLSTMNNVPSALINHPSHIPIPHLISLITFDFCHSPMTNQRSPIIHFQWTYHSPYFNHYPAPISCHSTPIIDYPLPIEYHKQPSTVAHQFSIHHSVLFNYNSFPITHYALSITHHQSLKNDNSLLITHQLSNITYHSSPVTISHSSFINYNSSFITITINHSSINNHNSSLITHNLPPITRHP